MFLKMNKKISFKKFIESEKTIFFFLFSFIFVNWLLMILSEKLACNDFYPYILASQELFVGNFSKSMSIPPLFPFLSGIIGRFFNLFLNLDGYILAGRIISLLSGFGTLIFSYKLLKMYSRTIALFGVTFIMISSFFLKLISTAQTDMLFLFFVSGFFYYLSVNKRNLFYLIGGLLTRFEGVVLFFLYILNIASKKIKYWKYILFILPFVAFVFYQLFIKFYYRLYYTLTYVVANKSLIYYLLHPKELAYLLYNSLLYFIPVKFLDLIKWSFFLLLLMIFIIGLFCIFKNKKVVFFSVISYMLIFLSVKGAYIGKLNPIVDFRRFLSFIWLFYIIVMIGVYNVIKYIKKRKKERALLTFLIIFLMIVLINDYSIKTIHSMLPIMLIIPIIVIVCIPRFNSKLFSLFIIIVLSLFSAKLYTTSINASYFYINNDTDVGTYIFSKWVKKFDRYKVTMRYCYSYMYEYYVGKDKGIKELVYDEKIYNNRKSFFVKYFKDLKKMGIKFIYFDGYVLVNQLKKQKMLKILFEERDKGKYFKLYKTFKYKGRYAGSLVIPLYDSVE